MLNNVTDTKLIILKDQLLHALFRYLRLQKKSCLLKIEAIILM